MDHMAFVRMGRGGVILEVTVQPRASRNELAGEHQGRLKVRLTAPPVEGEANSECVRFLARCLGVPKSTVEIVQGHKSRQKTVLVRGLVPEQVDALLRKMLI